MSSPYSLLSHRLSDFSSTISSSTTSAAMAVQAQSDASLFGGALVDAFKKHTSDPHSSHPDFAHLVLLVFEAVLEVVFISLPGYILARTGNFDAKQQKFIAEMNTSLFTPALIFTKLASQLTAETLVDLAIIPVIFVIQTAICYGSAEIVARLFRFRKRARYFVIAMAVFGNSNSLPISLVVSLSMTLKGLHWDKIPGDNDNEVAARGILYLLIFQQLGQVVRWSWGYNVLLAPADQFPDEPEGRNSRLERGDYLDSDPALTSPLLHDDSYLDDDECLSPDGYRTAVSHSDYESGAATPAKHGSYGSDIGSSSNSSLPSLNKAYHRSSSRGSSAGRRKPSFGNGHITSFPRPDTSESGPDDEDMAGKGWCARLGARCRNAIKGAFVRTGHAISRASWNLYQSLPSPLQLCLRTVWTVLVKFWNGLNPPLWAMIAAIVVASFPRLQHLFYDKGTLISNSFSRAVSQSGGVAVPLILVVLGGNLARNTLPEKDVHSSQHDPKLERNLLIASLISRMVVPFIVMAPILALFAKYVPVSILDDPIFIIVCFLLTGAPTALQLAQICQMNDVYMGVMSKILFQSYVVWILPSTLILVMAALEVVEWAT